MSTRSTIKFREAQEGEIGFHLYFDWLDLLEGCDASKPDPVYLCVEGADFNCKNSEVTIKLPRQTAVALGLIEVEEVEALRALLSQCRPIVESEMALFDSMARHMAGGFDLADIKSADDSANVHWELLKKIDAALEPKP